MRSDLRATLLGLPGRVLRSGGAATAGQVDPLFGGRFEDEDEDDDEDD